MPGFEMSEFINRSPQEVFDFISESENAPKVVPSVTSMVKLTEGPVRVGTRYRETRLMKGEEHLGPWCVSSPISEFGCFQEQS